MRTYATMRRNQPDFFIHCGDNIYADCQIVAEKKLPDGNIWRSIVTEEKSKPAETLPEYRGNYKYNLLDDNLRAFNAEVPTFALWDNHEVMETWWPDEPLPHKPAGEKNTLAFAARARRAFHEFIPIRETMADPGRVYRKIQYGPLLDVFMLDMRSYRGPDGPHIDRIYGAEDYLLGPTQISLLKRELTLSQATWKVIAADTPIGYIVNTTGIEHAGGPRGRGLEIADLLSFIKYAGGAQHIVAHGRPSLHRSTSLRPEPGGVSGFRASRIAYYHASPLGPCISERPHTIGCISRQLHQRPAHPNDSALSHIVTQREFVGREHDDRRSVLKPAHFFALLEIGVAS